MTIFDVGVLSLLHHIPLLLLQSLLCCVNILLHCHVDKLVLSLSLDHPGPLLPHPLDGLWDVDITVQPLAVNNVNEDVNDNNGACPADACTAVHHDRPCGGHGALSAVDFLQEPQHTTRFIRDAMVWPCQVLVVPDVPHGLLLQNNTQVILIKIR